MAPSPRPRILLSRLSAEQLGARLVDCVRIPGTAAASSLGEMQHVVARGTLVALRNDYQAREKCHRGMLRDTPDRVAATRRLIRGNAKTLVHRTRLAR